MDWLLKAYAIIILGGTGLLFFIALIMLFVAVFKYMRGKD